MISKPPSARRRLENIARGGRALSIPGFMYLRWEMRADNTFSKALRASQIALVWSLVRTSDRLAITMQCPLASEHTLSRRERFLKCPDYLITARAAALQAALQPNEHDRDRHRGKEHCGLDDVPLDRI